MLESVFIVLLAIAFVLFILGIEAESKIYCMISLVLWVIIFAQSLWITVPTDTTYSELSLSAISLIFVFSNLIYLLALQFDWRKNIP